MQAEGYARKQIARLNDRVCFKRAGITWDLKKSWGNSWVSACVNIFWSLKFASLLCADRDIIQGAHT